MKKLLCGIVFGIALAIAFPVYAICVNGSCGGGGTPGGANTSIQYNNTGAFGGFGTWNGTSLAVPGDITFGSGGPIGILNTGGAGFQFGGVGAPTFSFVSNNTNLQFQGAMAFARGNRSVANGLNSDVDIGICPGLGRCSLIRLTGPTGAFSLGGLDSGVNGQILYVFNTVSQTMTIVNEDASSTAANRITTLTGGNVIMRIISPSFATFIYDQDTTRWILTSTN